MPTASARTSTSVDASPSAAATPTKAGDPKGCARACTASRSSTTPPCRTTSASARTPSSSIAVCAARRSPHSVTVACSTATSNLSSSKATAPPSNSSHMPRRLPSSVGWSVSSSAITSTTSDRIASVAAAPRSLPHTRRRVRANVHRSRYWTATRATQTGIIDAGAAAVLNIGRLAPDGEAYYLDTVASGVEDYYTGGGEAPGYWLTESAAELGLAGRVDAADLRSVLGARHPRTGEALPRTSRRRVPGFDLAFRAPKSVSLVWALGDEGTAAVVRDAHDQAVQGALGYLERHAAWSRRGRNGIERVPVRGLIAAAFRHRSSRAGDPLLHTHVLVSNLGLCADGQWRTLDSPRLYTHALSLIHI